MMVKTQTFYTYEELIDFLDTETGFEPPRVIEGRKNFFNKFNKWFFDFDDNHLVKSKWKCIFPDPSLGLSYPYPIDEISVAVSTASFDNGHSSVQAILDLYHLNEKVAKQQVITLSGGELLLLCFAKAHVLKDVTDKMIICTPTQWLHPSKYEILNSLITLYEKDKKEIWLLLMEGEVIKNNTFTVNPPVPFLISTIIPSIPWSLHFKELVVEFDEETFPKKTPANTLKYLPSNFTEELLSPTLVIGNNGVGKSVFVKLLSGLVKPKNGKVTVRCLGNEGQGRILMQNSLSQLFGETIDNHFNRIFKYDKEKGKKAKEIYIGMLEKLKEKISSNPELRTKKLIATDSNFIETILQAKLALAAERIQSCPSLLILDEPDWCFSKSITILFIEIVVTIAHKNQIPVLIITHLNNWYSGYANSILEFKKGKLNNTIEVSSFKEIEKYEI